MAKDVGIPGIAPEDVKHTPAQQAQIDAFLAQQKREEELEAQRKARAEEEQRKADELERLRREEMERVAEEQQRQEALKKQEQQKRFQEMRARLLGSDQND